MQDNVMPFAAFSKLEITLIALQIEEKVGINITMVGIDECLLENHNCEGSCTNVLMIDRNPVMVNANRTSFVGVNTWVKAKCSCGARDFSEIESCRKRPPPCYNNGRCVDTYTGIRCVGFAGFSFLELSG